MNLTCYAHAPILVSRQGKQSFTKLKLSLLLSLVSIVRERHLVLTKWLTLLRISPTLARSRQRRLRSKALLRTSLSLVPKGKCRRIRTPESSFRPGTKLLLPTKTLLTFESSHFTESRLTTELLPLESWLTSKLLSTEVHLVPKLLPFKSRRGPTPILLACKRLLVPIHARKVLLCSKVLLVADSELESTRIT